MLAQQNKAIAVVNRLIEGAAMRKRGLDETSQLGQNFTIELEAYGRVLDALMQLQEKKESETEILDLHVTTI